MNELLKKLLGFLSPGVEGEDDPLPEPLEDEPDLPDDTDPDYADEELAAESEPRAASRKRDDSAERLARLEAEVERRGRMAAEAASRQPAPVDHEYQREEERLKDPNTTEMERWQIQANRTLRDTQAQARTAMFQAQDLSDRTRFESKINSDPRRAKYADRVEEEIQKARSRGQPASREDVYYWMLGKDIADGKLKSKPKAASAPAVPRGKTPGVRGDVQGRGRPSSEKDKLRSRLENLNI